MSKSVFGIATTHGQAERIVEQLQAQGFATSEISVLMPDTGGTRDVGHVKATKAPEGATTGAAAGGATGGVLGLMAGIGALAIPGVGPFSWRQARRELEPFLKEQPDNYTLIGDLALTNMGLGEKTAALALAEQAIAMIPIEKDAIAGPIPIEILARVAAQMGEPDRAIVALQKLLSISYAAAHAGTPLTPALLRLDPMFDPLRNDPRFQKLCEEKQP